MIIYNSSIWDKDVRINFMFENSILHPYVRRLGKIHFIKIKYARKSSYHEFLVWMGNAILRASCSKPRHRLCFWCGFSHPHQEHMKDTYNPHILYIYADITLALKGPTIWNA